VVQDYIHIFLICLHAHTHAHAHTHIYIYIYIYIGNVYVCSKRKSKRENVVGSATVKVIWKFLLMACNVTAPTSLILCEVRILMWCVCVRACKKQRKKTGISHFNLRCKSFDLPPPPPPSATPMRHLIDIGLNIAQ